MRRPKPPPPPPTPAPRRAVKQAGVQSQTVSPAKVTGMSSVVRARSKTRTNKRMGYGSKLS